MTAHAVNFFQQDNFGRGAGINPYQPGTPIPWRPYTPPPAPQPPYAPSIPNVGRQVSTQFITTDYTLQKVRAICAMLEAKAITRAEARKMLAALDPAFAKVLG